MRKCKTKGKRYTAGDILSPGFVDKLTMQDDGYRVLRTIRASPPYWEQAKRDLFAMIRQLGIPTWFCSFSAAETKWEPLLTSLSKLVKGEDLNSDEIKLLNWHDKCYLIKSDPVTCARYFDFRVQTFIKNVLYHKSEPIGKLQDHFYRVEFQQRGSPHIHMLLWVENAPKHGLSLNTEITQFIDKYVTCSKDDSIPTLINYQTHRHAKTCRKKGKAVCRFHFPLPPMPETMILKPLNKDEMSSEHLERYEKISAALNAVSPADCEMSFQEFLDMLGITKDEYILAIRSSLKKETLFLKRMLSECRINNYNKALITCWEANIDIQFILDPYSCVSYIVSYISKGQRGLSNLLLDACLESKEANSDIRQQVRRIGNQFLSSVEIGAQEAAYLVLQIPLRRCTREVVFVDTNKPEARTALLKPFSELKELSSSSDNIEMDNTLKRYTRRPKVLEQLCYADFACWYSLCKKSNSKQGNTENAPELPEVEYEHDTNDEIEQVQEFDGKVVKFQCGLIMKKRLKQRVMYCHFTPINKDREEHYREQIMLYTAWRDEERDLIGMYNTFEERFNAEISLIERNRANYVRVDSEAFEKMVDHAGFQGEDVIVDVNPEIQHQEMMDSSAETTLSEQYGCFDPGTNNTEVDYDIGEELGIARKSVVNAIEPCKEMTNQDYLKAVQQLNTEQKTFFYHVLHLIKSGQLPFYTFLSGGAGNGKSVVVRVLYQAVLKYLNCRSNTDPSTEKVLLCAPTGKAAHNISGNTIHSAFCIPVSQGFHFKPLDMQQLNTLRARLHDLKVIIIDEISMVGRNMFNFINLRLQEIMGCSKPFGNVSVLAVGDLFQLKPVMDSWLFSTVHKTVQMNCIATNLWTDLFDFFELTKVMRQKDDEQFAFLLNRLREGKHTHQDLETLKERCIDKTGAGYNQLVSIPHIFCRKNDASNHNDYIISKIPRSEIVEITAIDTVSGNLSSALHDTILSKVSTDSSRTMNLDGKLVLGVGVPCDVCLNICVDDGLTNGASCVVKKMDFRVPNSNRCSIVWVMFEDISVGVQWRAKYRHLYNADIDSNWTPIFETTRQFTVQYFKTYLVIRRQFPLKLAAGKTIHKAQGSTMLSAVMHFGNRKVDHIHYVGLSRVTNISGVHILHLNSDKISVSPEVEEEMVRLRNERLLQSSVVKLDCWRESMSNYIICFQNCRSLSKHIDDIRQESNLLNADVLGLVETRAHDPIQCRSLYQIDGFAIQSSTLELAAHGIAVYQKFDFGCISFHNFCKIECAILRTPLNVVVCFVYCPPREAKLGNYKQFMEGLLRFVNSHFENCRLVLMGDFNVDYDSAGLVPQLFLEQYRLKQFVTTVTTDYGSCLDHIYTNLGNDDLVAYGSLESYYSDHKPLYLVLKQSF